MRGRVSGFPCGCIAASMILAAACSDPPEPATPIGDNASALTEARPAAPTSHHPCDNASSGTVTGMAPPAQDDMPSVILLQSKTAYAYPPAADKPMMDQVARRFTPNVLVVRTGQPADFRNDDDTTHNVRVREGSHGGDDPAFNVALPQGGSYRYAFAKDGIWDVRCDMHQTWRRRWCRHRRRMSPSLHLTAPSSSKAWCQAATTRRWSRGRAAPTRRSKFAEGERLALTFKTATP